MESAAPAAAATATAPAAAAAAAASADAEAAAVEPLLRSLITAKLKQADRNAVTLRQVHEWVRSSLPQGRMLVRRHRALIRWLAVDAVHGPLQADNSGASGTDTEEEAERPAAAAASSAAAAAAVIVAPAPVPAAPAAVSTPLAVRRPQISAPVATPAAAPSSAAASAAAAAASPLSLAASAVDPFASPAAARPVRGESSSSGGSLRRPCRAATIGWDCQWCSMSNSIRDSVCSMCGHDKLATGPSPAVEAETRSHKARARRLQAQRDAEQAAQARSAALAAMLAEPMPLPTLDWDTVRAEVFDLPSHLRPASVPAPSPSPAPAPSSAVRGGAGVAAAVSPYHCDSCEQWILQGFNFYHCITCESLSIPLYSYDLCAACWNSSGGKAREARTELHDPASHVMRPREALFALGEDSAAEEEEHDRAARRARQEEKWERTQPPAAAAAGAGCASAPRRRGRPFLSETRARAAAAATAAPASFDAALLMASTAAASRSQSVASVVSASSLVSPPPSGGSVRKRAAAADTQAPAAAAGGYAEPGSSRCSSGKRAKMGHAASDAVASPSNGVAASHDAPHDPSRMLLLQQRYRQHMAEAEAAPDLDQDQDHAAASSPARSRPARAAAADDDDESLVDMTIGAWTPPAAFVKLEPKDVPEQAHTSSSATAAAAAPGAISAAASAPSSSVPHANDEVCHYCHDGGDLWLCDLCVHAYHLCCLEKHVSHGVYAAVAALHESDSFACATAGLPCTPRAKTLTMQDVIHEDEVCPGDAAAAAAAPAAGPGAGAGAGASASVSGAKRRKKRQQRDEDGSPGSSDGDEPYFKRAPRRIAILPPRRARSNLSESHSERSSHETPVRSASTRPLRSSPRVKLEPGLAMPTRNASASLSALQAEAAGSDVPAAASAAASAAAAPQSTTATPMVVVPILSSAAAAAQSSSSAGGVDLVKQRYDYLIQTYLASPPAPKFGSAGVVRADSFPPSLASPPQSSAAAAVAAAAARKAEHEEQERVEALSLAQAYANSTPFEPVFATTPRTDRARAALKHGASAGVAAAAAATPPPAAAAAPVASSAAVTATSSASSAVAAPRVAPTSLQWKCHSCTLNNSSSRWRCGMCDTVRLVGPRWECQVCTFSNAGSDVRCSVCESARLPGDVGLSRSAPGLALGDGDVAMKLAHSERDVPGAHSAASAAAAAAVQLPPAAGTAASAAPAPAAAAPSSSSAAAAAAGSAAAGAAAASSSGSAESDVLLLVGMGFSRFAAEEALRANGHSRERALDWLLGQPEPMRLQRFVAASSASTAAPAAAAAAAPSPASASASGHAGRIRELQAQLDGVQQQLKEHQNKSHRQLERQRSVTAQQGEEHSRIVAARDGSVAELQRDLAAARDDLARALAREQQAVQQLTTAQQQHAQTAQSLVAANERITALSSQLSTAASERECTVCLDRARNVLFLPCAHVVACAHCAGPASSTRHHVDKCTQCARKIKKRIVILG